MGGVHQVGSHGIGPLGKAAWGEVAQEENTEPQSGWGWGWVQGQPWTGERKQARDTGGGRKARQKPPPASLLHPL